ncbi:DUF7282 domain-containing protein [Hyphomicrobium sp.]|uniref:DUF7282 domain-containing protein n=1 Tax=Hyphomicrobium sp. TaxID=82 RepID=UPI002E2EE7D2|nr:hypothetical protein [Hyphomicrobium sp.]HEX2841405.1 hypothetical protein [Hyphomicrobium sp.]
MSNEIKTAVTGTALSALFIASAATIAGAALPISDPSVIAMSQKIRDGAVTLDYVYLPQKGYAVVYAVDKSGQQKEALGSVELSAGDHRGVKVALKSTPPTGSKLWVSLYADKDGKPGFDAKGDISHWPAGLPYINKITVE